MEQIPSLLALTLLRPEESDCTQALWIIHNVFICAPGGGWSLLSGFCVTVLSVFGFAL